VGLHVRLPRRVPNLPCHVTQGIFKIIAAAELLALDGKSCTLLGTSRPKERFYGNFKAFNLYRFYSYFDAPIFGPLMSRILQNYKASSNNIYYEVA
jgi:hypothetical protein